MTAHRPDDREALLAVASQLHRAWPGWERVLIVFCAGYHLAVAVVLTAFPYDRLLTEGTRPVLELLSPGWWSFLFFGGAVSAGLLLVRDSWLLQLVTLIGVLLLGGTWLTAFALAVLNGDGSPVLLAVWPFFYGPWFVLAIRIAQGKR